MISNRVLKFTAILFVAVFVVNMIGGVSGPVGAETSSVSSEAAKPFSDVQDEGKYYYKPVKWAAKHGVTYGYDDGTFRPENTVTRAQMITFLWRMCGSPEPKVDIAPFFDMKETDYWYTATAWGFENGIVEGYNDGTFRPQNACTRAQAVTFMYRMSDKKDHIKGGDYTFADLDGKEKAYYYKPAYWGMKAGIVVGIATDEEGVKKFNPQGKITRGQMVTFLYKLAKYSTKTDGAGALKHNVMHSDGTVPTTYNKAYAPTPTTNPYIHSYELVSSCYGVDFYSAQTTNYGRVITDFNDKTYYQYTSTLISKMFYVSKEVDENDFYIKFKGDAGFRDIGEDFLQFIPDYTDPVVIAETEYRDDGKNRVSSMYSDMRYEYMKKKGYTKTIRFDIECSVEGDISFDLYYKGTKIDVIRSHGLYSSTLSYYNQKEKEILADVTKYKANMDEFDLMDASEYWIRHHSYYSGYSCDACEMVSGIMKMYGHPAILMSCAEKTDKGVENNYSRYHSCSPRTKKNGGSYGGHVISIIFMDKTHYVWIEVEGSLALQPGETDFSSPWKRNPDGYSATNMMSVNSKQKLLRDYDTVYDMVLGDFGVDLATFDPYDCSTWY